MPAIPGRLAKLSVSDDGGTTYKNVGGVVDVTLNVNVDELETTTHDSAGAREYIPNHHDVTMDISARWLELDPGQEILLQATFAKTSVLFKFSMQSASGRKLFTGRCFATTNSPSGPLDDTGSLDLSLRASGVQMGVQP